MSRVVILGGGFGGLTVATELSRRLDGGGEHEIVLVDRRERFSMGLRKLWELVGHATIAEGSRPRDALAAPGVRVVREEVVAIDPGARAVTLSESGVVDADHLVVALGAEPHPELVPGLGEHGHDVWDVAGVPGAAEALAAFDGGRVVILIAGAPYPCPPAPYECAMHVHEHLTERGLWERSEIEIVTVQPILMPNAGGEGSEWIAGKLAERGIGYRTGVKVERVEAGGVVLGDGELAFDLLIGVPPHRVPEVVKASGLLGDSGWVKVDPGTFETAHSGVFAIGDVTGVKLANGLPLPKAGIIAELEGERVAAAIAAEVQGEGAPAPFDGHGFCFFEMGTKEAALIEGEFYAEPAPRVTLAEPDAVHAEEKRRFETERLERWFEG